MIDGTATITNPGLTQSAFGSGALKALGRDEFLNLLVAQMKHQDPLKPQDGSEFAAQLAQFSSLEQLINLNQQLGGVMRTQQQANGTMALSYLGREVSAQGNTLGIKGGAADPITYEILGEARRVTVDILNDSGRLVRRLELANQGTGLQRIPFDGQDASGSPLPDGQYSFAVTAEDGQGSRLPVTPFVEGIVTGIAQRNGVSVLRVGNTEVAIEGITAVRQPQGSTP